MKSLTGSTPILVLLAAGWLLLTSCGYHNPNVLPELRDLPPTRIYVPMWQNATNEMGLESTAHSAVSDWLLQSGRIVLVADEEEAEYILTGRISSIRYPGFSYDITTTAQALNAVLTSAVSLTERESGRIIWQNPSLRLEETYNLESSVSQTDANQREALSLLVDSLAEQVYLRVLRSLAAVRTHR
ncbi:MAG: LPS assembly lipoprotein LptE [Desulfurivibrio sp.]